MRLDIEDIRQRHANSIRNTYTGRILGEALDEIESLRAQLAEAHALLREACEAWTTRQQVAGDWIRRAKKEVGDE